jgi:MFS transporter, FHS family, L-fucose permease
MSNTTNKSALYTLMVVWFFWSFIGASNGILIPLCKEKFGLTQTQAQFIDFAFYIAYFLGSLLYLFISYLIKSDLLNRIGYKNGIVIGLLISAVGAFLFYPAAENSSFALLLTALFIVGLGFSLQQTATQPYVIALGPPESGAQRINLGGAINNIGGTIGPLIVSYAIFGSIAKEASATALISDVKGPYLIMGVLFILMALFFWFSKLPKVSGDDVKITKDLFILPLVLIIICILAALLSSIDFAVVILFWVSIISIIGYTLYTVIKKSTSPIEATSVLNYPQLVLGMAAIFIYVGVEVTIGSNLGEYLKQTENLESSQIGKYVSLFWGSMMIGRWTAAIGVFNPSKSLKSILVFIVPFLAFALIFLVNYISSGDVSELIYYIPFILLMIMANYFSQEKPVKLLLTFTFLGALMTLLGVLTSGKLALFSLISGGLFCSVLWPAIFSLATAGLGKYTNQGVAFLIMMILGGAIIPVMQGNLADNLGIKNSYLLATACFAYLFIFGIITQRILKSQNIDFDEEIAKSNNKNGH